MHVTLYGATGRAGSRILLELTRRGHAIRAVARRSDEQAATNDGLRWVTDDLSEIEHTAAAIRGTDAVISAYGPPPDDTDQLLSATRTLAEAVKASGVPRLLVVGGAGGLLVAPGVTLLDSGKLPLEWQPIARAHGATYEMLRSTSIDWTYVAPAAFFDPGERTGHYRSSPDSLVVDAQDQSKISMEDYAIAMVDELEAPKHRRARFAVGW